MEELCIVYGLEAVLPIEVEVPSLTVIQEVELDEAKWAQVLGKWAIIFFTEEKKRRKTLKNPITLPPPLSSLTTTVRRHPRFEVDWLCLPKPSASPFAVLPSRQHLRPSFRQAVSVSVSVRLPPPSQSTVALFVVNRRRSPQLEPHAHPTRSANPRGPFSSEPPACESYPTSKLRFEPRPPPSAELLPPACSSRFACSQPSR
ncbi:uncharacterized protein E6C27_scaffold62G00350 [Cucumis melo var. makuwa]|uniref:Uncharacterized protein n=1 Tax=Cucumis melo var. makuwa TaxID=1194695 RepID=A0A5A7VE36_CUCMM|nr:uncharacterized protein E6C27_scaffold62G00350 [Cucumis melo var. makuwa]